MAAITSANKFLLAPVIWVSLMTSCLVVAQYSGGGGGGYSYGGGGGGQSHMSGGAEEFEGPEDRPKVRLGIRLRIPAFKFELPRFSLPKITVSAKIRQPDGPRVIRLPEINFDTSSKVEPPGGGGGDGGGSKAASLGGGGGYSSGQYQASPSYSMASYGSGGGGDAGKSNTFTFSTGEETPGAHEQATNYGGDSGARYNYANQYRPASPASGGLAAKMMNSGNGNYQMVTAMRQQQQQQQQMVHYQRQVSMRQQQQFSRPMQSGYSSTNVHPRYSMYNMPPGGLGAQSAYQYRVEEGASPPSANPDLGFNSPETVGRA